VNAGEDHGKEYVVFVWIRSMMWIIKMSASSVSSLLKEVKYFHGEYPAIVQNTNDK
jgi:hypothetical protein